MRSRFKRYVKVTLAVVLLAPPVLVLLLFVLVALSRNSTYWDLRRQAESSYIPQIEKFKLQHGFYPDPRTQTIVPEYGSFDYASDGADYCVAFAIWIDPTYNYCSQTQKWAEGVGPVFEWPTGPWPTGAPSKK